MKRRGFLQWIGAALVAPALPVTKTSPAKKIVYEQVTKSDKPTEPVWPVGGNVIGIGKTIKWRRYSPLKVATTPLCEGTVPTGDWS